MTTAIILAAGKSERMGNGVDKAFLSLVNKPVIAWSLMAFEKCVEVDRIILVVRKEQLLASKAVVKMFGISKIQAIIAGGRDRQDSVREGLKICDIDTKFVLIHDGARPCVTPEMISTVLKMVKRVPAATLGAPVCDTIKRCEKGITVSETIPRARLWAVQTPQGFQVSTIRDAYAKLGDKKITDDCQAVEMMGVPVKVIENLKPNFKITTVEDWHLAGALLK